MQPWRGLRLPGLITYENFEAKRKRRKCFGAGAKAEDAALADQTVAELKRTEQFFDRSTRALSEEHSGVRPAPGMMSAVQQVAHAAQTIDWFIEGEFRPEGFDTDFQAYAKALED